MLLISCVRRFEPKTFSIFHISICDQFKLSFRIKSQTLYILQVRLGFSLPPPPLPVCERWYYESLESRKMTPASLFDGLNFGQSWEPIVYCLLILWPSQVCREPLWKLKSGSIKNLNLFPGGGVCKVFN